MQMKGLDVLSAVRLTQPNDALDIDVDQLSTNLGVIQNEFYAFLFFDMLNGEVTGAAPVTTGIKLKLYNVAGAVVVESDAVKLDWYETETAYISEAAFSKVQALGSDTYISKAVVSYVGNDGGVAKEVDIFESTAFAKSVFASADTSSNKGILISVSNGSLTATGSLQFSISK